MYKIFPLASWIADRTDRNLCDTITGSINVFAYHWPKKANWFGMKDILKGTLDKRSAWSRTASIRKIGLGARFPLLVELFMSIRMQFSTTYVCNLSYVILLEGNGQDRVSVGSVPLPVHVSAKMPASNHCISWAWGIAYNPVSRAQEQIQDKPHFIDELLNSDTIGCRRYPEEQPLFHCVIFWNFCGRKCLHQIP